MTIDDISQAQTEQIPTDFQAFLDKRSRRSGQRKRPGIKSFRRARHPTVGRSHPRLRTRILRRRPGR